MDTLVVGDPVIIEVRATIAFGASDKFGMHGVSNWTFYGVRHLASLEAAPALSVKYTFRTAVTLGALPAANKYGSNSSGSAPGWSGAACVMPVKEVPMAEPRDVIHAAIHSAFVKYPKEDDPASHDHWIQPEEAAHLTKVVMMELEANGFEIVKRK